MSVLHPWRPAEADRSRIRSYDQVRATAVGRPQMGVLGLGNDRGRAIGCGDLAGVTGRRRGGTTMRQRPATRTPHTTTAPGARRQVTIATVRAAESQASLEETLALIAALGRLAELLGPRRCLTVDGEVYR